MATTEPATDQNHQPKQEIDDVNTNSTDELEKQQQRSLDEDDDDENEELEHKTQIDNKGGEEAATSAIIKATAPTTETDTATQQNQKSNEQNNDEEDEDLEEGELKGDDDDDDEDENDDDHDNLLEDSSKRLPSNINNNNNNISNNNNNDNFSQSSANHLSHMGGVAGQSGPGYLRGGPGGVGPMHKVNIRCRFYSKTSNKCTWGDHCRFEHRDDSPDPEFDGRLAPPGSSRGMIQPPPGAPMGVADPIGYIPPYGPRHQPYPPPHLTGGSMGPAERSPHYSLHAGRHHQPYPPPPMPGGPMGPADRGHPYPPYPPRHHHTYHQTPPPPGAGGAPSPNYPSPSSSSSSVVYERKHRLAYELAPWNDSRGYPPPPSKYDRGDPGGFSPGGRGFYRNHYGREPAYGREPIPSNMGGGGPHPSYPSTYPSAYGGGPMEPHASHYNKYMGSSQRNMPSDTRRSRSNKRGHDDDESSWSDSGSEDSILGQPNYSSRNKANKQAHHHHHPQPHSQPQQSQTTPVHQLSQHVNENDNYDDPPEQGSGTPPGEPLPEDKERQEMLLNKLKEIEDLMAKKKGEQEDPGV